MTEYRLEDLAQRSGVSARNIRAYRERGLLDSPRRAGRAAYYDDRHLSQLTAISQLLSRGFSSAHIAEFFASLRRGQDLADALGIAGLDWCRSTLTLTVPPVDEDARTLVEFGLAREVDGIVELTDPTLVAVVAAADNQQLCVQKIARVVRSAGAVIDGLAESAGAALTECRGGGVQAGSGVELAHAVVAARMKQSLRSVQV